MTKEKFIAIYAEELDTTKVDAEKKFDAFISSLLHTFEQGEGLTIRGFGNFEITERSARKGRNPNTQEDIVIPAKKVVKFKPGKAIKEIIK